MTDMTPEQEAELLQGRADAAGLALAFADNPEGAHAMLASITFGEAARLLISLCSTVADMVRIGEKAAAGGHVQPSAREQLTALLEAARQGVQD
ncbi:hypothetical protein KUM39_26250 [Streptomyces sp. J2-1]|uniref:hypothetical protein n=1 Tax=Streptomyces corallincola TaxID=2851888 RepID=UPI001C38ABA3|nr:hypothetical protein [Streptomyces corallincola]MBV2357816.1 hypothetical protein [Streptomyces corallincola]